MVYKVCNADRLLIILSSFQEKIEMKFYAIDGQSYHFRPNNNGAIESIVEGEPGEFLGRCRSVETFEKVARIGEGTYGIVCTFIL